MDKEFGIYTIQTYEVRTPIGPRQVISHKKIGALTSPVPDRMIEHLNGREFNSPQFFEGIGNVLVQTKDGIFPQPIHFLFDESVTDFKVAFEQFDAHMDREIKRLQQEQQEQEDSSIQTASESTLKKLDAAANKALADRKRQTASGIVLP